MSRRLVALPLIGLAMLSAVSSGHAAERVLTTHGTVRRILPDVRLVLIAHEEIPGSMEAMDSMAFSVDEHPVLRTVKPGDRVQFTLQQSGSTLTLLRIDLAR